MERHSIQEYMHIGAMNWHLVRLPNGIKAKGPISAHSSIKDFHDIIERAGLNVTNRAGQRLWQILEELEKMSAADNVVTPLLEEIRSEAKIVERTLVAESLGKIVFVVTEKRIDIDKLLNAPATLLSSKVWVTLPKISAHDFAEGCKAIAFELPTAGAFYLLRSLEGALGHYYLCAIRKDRLSGNSRMWGPMIKQMRDKKDNVHLTSC